MAESKEEEEEEKTDAIIDADAYETSSYESYYDEEDE